MSIDLLCALSKRQPEFANSSSNFINRLLPVSGKPADFANCVTHNIPQICANALPVKEKRSHDLLF